METTTPKKVRWETNFAARFPGSPFSEGVSSESFTSTSSLQYINEQLVAHGFAPSPGLCLDGLLNHDMERVVKCLLGMLSQRMEDMSRTENLTTKYGTLSYEHERLSNMHKAAKEEAANASRELETMKTRLANANRTLESTKAAHKQTIADLQRTRTTLQSVRSTHNAELKKKEKEVERTLERWSKITDAQVKLGNGPSGMRCANGAIVEGVTVRKGKGFLEVAAEQAESAAKESRVENEKLKRLVLRAVNEAQSILYLAKGFAEETHEEPTPLTLTALFPISPTTAASDKLQSLLSGLRDSLSLLSSRSSTATLAPSTTSTASTSTKVTDRDHEEEVTRLQSVIDALRTELDQAKQAASQSTSTSTNYKDQIQGLFSRLTEHERTAPRHGNNNQQADADADTVDAPSRDEKRQRVKAKSREFEADRRGLTEENARLGKERAGLETKRVRLEEERRQWVLNELPPVSGASSHEEPEPEPELVLELEPVSQPFATRSKLPRRPTDTEQLSQRPITRAASRKSAGKSPIKAIAVGASKRKSRRRSSAGLGLSPPTRVAEPSFETEVIPPPTREGKEAKGLLMTEFVLPPPSPVSKVPPMAPELFGRPSVTSSSASASASASSAPVRAIHTQQKASEEPAHGSTNASTGNGAQAVPPPITPGRRPFPMAKPRAPHMAHAYSPMKPSPLSRILKLGNSPNSDNSGSDQGSPQAPAPIPAIRLEDLMEASEDEEDDRGATRSTVPTGPKRDGRRDGSLKGKEKPPVVYPPPKGKPAQPSAGPSQIARGKRKATAMDPPAKPRTAGAASRARSPEKEQPRKRLKTTKDASVPAPSITKGKAPAAAGPPRASRTTTKPLAVGNKSTLNKKPPAKGGPRRVPIGSAEAAPVVTAWKG